MIEFFCPRCEKESLDSFSVGLKDRRTIKCDFCFTEFIVKIEKKYVYKEGDVCMCDVQGNFNCKIHQTVNG